VIEFHEILDTGEARMGIVRGSVRLLGPVLLRMASAYAVHSTFDRDLVIARYKVGSRPIHVLPHGPHDHYQGEGDEDALPAARSAPSETCNLLFFGVIRPYKGLEDLVAAFDRIPEDAIEGFWLTVVGETWEGWTLPAEMIRSSRYRDRITFVNRYVHDRELDAHLRGADAVILPYRRSSLSGPLHVAMGYGLPIVISDVGGNAEAANGYEGVVLAKPADPNALSEAIRAVAQLRGRQFAHPTSWDRTREAYEAVFADLDPARRKRGSGR
jgi:glycosyltransferase involved in cell wall biosynthesis